MRARAWKGQDGPKATLEVVADAIEAGRPEQPAPALAAAAA
ncbi:hypothetical protein [Sphaerisporangium sp. TRM90804]|nr:hypothetical protein [Sphaerisporangium sp. TRM90804]MDH2426438.1 hypothetical protein [Sphaerisporangium sp. TRM90804]